MRIEGARAVVTGANRGLGAAFVERLAEQGAACVYACARDPAALGPLQDRLGPVVRPLRLDVTDRAAAAAAADAAADATLLINNAGVLRQLSLMEAGATDALRAEAEVNLFGLAEMCLALGPRIAANGGGAIVNMLSVASLVAFPAFASYAATKAAAMSLTHSLRWDFRDQGVSVHGVYAGFIDTDMVGGVAAEKADPREVAARALAGVAAGRLDIPTDARSEQFVSLALGGLPEISAAAFERADAFRAAHPARPSAR